MVHDPKSLLRMCKEMDEYAKKKGIGSFDGYDVGNVDTSKSVRED